MALSSEPPPPPVLLCADMRPYPLTKTGSGTFSVRPVAGPLTALIVTHEYQPIGRPFALSAAATHDPAGYPAAQRTHTWSVCRVLSAAQCVPPTEAEAAVWRLAAQAKMAVEVTPPRAWLGSVWKAVVVVAHPPTRRSARAEAVLRFQEVCMGSPGPSPGLWA